MLLRRAALPLLLILAVALTAGCVTVRSERPARAARTAPAAEPGTVAGALPLGRLPASQTPSSPAPDSEPATAAEAQESQGRVAPPRNRGRAPDPPARPVRPAPAPRKRGPAQPRPRPAQPLPYDMSSLCEAAKGTVHPSIVALCR
ncbi:hypothetical protein [Streptomyces roseus]|uniref:Lipoprotein n=1 Tax=Streptomyces roseus TaxID=66430 RepID=A0A0J6XMS0_9ACTN|nr:hypothetical protein [Streptomyces roseus]KMO95532.1 hypothetical protein ACS04_23085 [Streptomyces roseus]